MARLLTVIVLLLFAPAFASAQGELAYIDYQSAPPYVLRWNGGSKVFPAPLGSPGPKGAGELWNFSHFASGGWNNRAFMRYHWWDTDVSGVQAGAAGWYDSGSSFRPATGWLDVPYYLRFRVRVSSPLIPHGSSSICDGDTQMKFFVWNMYSGEGTDRVIMMFHAGSQAGASNSTHTAVQLRAGVSGSWAMTTIPNQQWVHVQLAWKWGAEGTAFQRIYVNNNNVGAPNAQNLQFNDLDMHGVPDHWGPIGGPTMLNGQFMFGDIDNTGSCVAEDAAIDVHDVELATAFDSAWYPGGSTSTPPPAPSSPSNFRIISGLRDTLLLPVVAFGLMLGTRRRTKER